MYLHRKLCDNGNDDDDTLIIIIRLMYDNYEKPFRHVFLKVN